MPNGELWILDALSVGFNHTPDLLVHDGYLYLSSWHNSRILRVELDSMLVENYAGTGCPTGCRRLYFGDEGPALDAALDLPTAVAMDRDGNLAIMDQANQVIRMVDRDGIIHRLAGNCIAENDAPCEPGQEPVACPGSNKLVCGSLEECSKECTPAYAGDGGDRLDMRLAQEPGQDALPGGRLAYDPDGRLVLADTLNHRLRRIDREGIVTTIAGTGEIGFAGDGGASVDAQLNMPIDVEIAADGSIFFADTGNHCVRRIDLSGIISTAAGRCGESGFEGDGGDPTDALLNLPFGIELDGDRMYVADTLNHRVRVVSF